jgi:hypothetical protein
MRRLLPALCLLGCSVFGKPDRVAFEFVVLTVDPPGLAEGTVPPPTATLDVNRVTVAAYLDRIEVVTRSGLNLITFSDKERWGEVLFSAVPRILSADLGRRLAADGVAVTQGAAGADFTLSVTVDRFERRANGEVELAARWMVETRATRLTGETHLVERIDSPTPAANATAQSRALGRLSGEIAEAVRRMRAAAHGGPPRE